MRAKMVDARLPNGLMAGAKIGTFEWPIRGANTAMRAEPFVPDGPCRTSASFSSSNPAARGDGVLEYRAKSRLHFA
jgi:hypothetical protein